MPLDIAKMFPDLWVDEESEEGKNLNEEPMIQTLIQRYRKNYSFSYNKVYEARFGERLLGNLNSLKQYQLNAHRAELRRYALPRPHREQDDPRAGQY